MTRTSCMLMMLATLLVAACGKSASTEPGKPEDAQGSVLVQTSLAQHQPLTETVALYGEVVQDVGASENISFARPVQISKLLVSAGQPVHRGQALLEVVTDPTAASVYLQAQAAVVAARREFNAQQELATERLTTQSQLATAKKNLTDAETALEAQRKLGTSPGAQTVRATHDGVVAALSAQQGDRVQAGTTVLQLAQAGGQRALLGAEPEDARQLAPGMVVKLSPVFGGDPVAASIVQVFAVINPQTRLVDVAVRISAGSAQLIAGQKVSGEIVLRSPELWTVPRAAVLEDSDGAYLFQIAGNHAKRVTVHIRVENGELAGIEGAINPKLPVVVLGNYELTDGASVRNAMPAETPVGSTP
jgi:RND family efflux transporter MFP subunit